MGIDILFYYTYFFAICQCVRELKTPAEKLNRVYGKHPEYPVADARYGSFNNSLYCEEHGMKKYMKFTMYEKEIKDKAS